MALGSVTARVAPTVALSGFDGWHLGHRQLMDTAVRIAAARHSALIAVVLDDAAHADHLSSVADRCRMAMVHGAAGAHVVAMDSRDRGEEADRVIDEIVSRIRPEAIVMARLPAAAASARYPTLRSAISRRHVALVETDRWASVDGQAVTSRGVATALAGGDVATAFGLLGHSYSVRNMVVHGSGLGRTIGFPTANVQPPRGRVVPARGVYAGHAVLADGTRHPAAINVGVRPTVEHDGTLLIEAHLLGFDGDLYDRPLDVSFRVWLRGEQTFQSLDELVDQLGHDARRAAIALR